MAAVVRRLEKAYGNKAWRAGRPPLDSLIGTILSQNTNDRNSGAAMARLTEMFRDWDEAADAPLRKIASAIRPAGLHQQKSRTIRAILRRLRAEHGRATLDFLVRWPTDDIREYLLSLAGVGPKTAACVLMFSLRRPVLPVDTHVHRVSKRLGLIGPKVSAEKAHDLLARIVPPEKVYAFHVLMIQHGRRVCHARRPDHAACCLKDLCPSADA